MLCADRGDTAAHAFKEQSRQGIHGLPRVVAMICVLFRNGRSVLHTDLSECPAPERSLAYLDRDQGQAGLSDLFDVIVTGRFSAAIVKAQQKNYSKQQKPETENGQQACPHFTQSPAWGFLCGGEITSLLPTPAAWRVPGGWAGSGAPTLRPALIEWT